MFLTYCELALKRLASKPYVSQCQKGSREMKKLVLTNTIVVILFILFDPLLSYLLEWADTYKLGAELALGMLTYLLFGFFILLSLCLISYSIVKCIVKRDMKQLIPITVFFLGIVGYMAISDSGSLWIKLVNYFVHIT